MVGTRKTRGSRGTSCSLLQLRTMADKRLSRNWTLHEWPVYDLTFIRTNEDRQTLH